MKFIYKKFLTFFAVSLLFVVLFAFGSSAAFIDHEGNEVAVSEVTDLTGCQVSINILNNPIPTSVFAVYDLDIVYDSVTYEFFSLAGDVVLDEQINEYCIVSAANSIVFFNGSFYLGFYFPVDDVVFQTVNHSGSTLDEVEFIISGGDDVSNSDLISSLNTYATVTLPAPPPSILDVVISLFTAVGEWISNAVTAIIPMFWDGESLTFVGVLVCAALAVSVSFLIINVISRFLNFRG